MLTISQFRPYILRLMADGKTRHAAEIVAQVCDIAKLSAPERDERLETGQRRAENRIGWGYSSFVKAGILERPARGQYVITKLGRQQAQQWQKMEIIHEKDLIGLPQWDSYQQALKERRATQSDNTENGNEPPDTLALQAVQQIEAATALELLARLRSETPEFFEKTVIKVLLAMGYGGRENLFEHLGRSHDGGIDGVIRQDPLGIQKIYIQAKRYAQDNNIGSEAIQAFAGALQHRGAQHGVFITTSAFTPAAQAFAANPINKVVLINGNELASLMIRYKVGIQVRHTLEIIQLDEDFFESF